MSHEITDWIKEAITVCGVDATEAEPPVAAKVIKEAISRFVAGAPRVWWLSLSQPSHVFSSNDKTLAEMLPNPFQRCWLIGDKPRGSGRYMDTLGLKSARPLHNI